MKRQVLNPYLPSWEYVPDGEPRVFGDRLYIYGSHDVAAGTDFCPGDYVCWSAPTSDLSDWRYEGVIFRKTDDPRNASGKAPLFAPDVVQGPDGRFYLYYAIPMVMFGQEDRIGVAVCDEPAGHFRFLGDVHMPDGSPLNDASGCGVVFDPGVHVEDGQTWLYWGFGASLPIPGQERREQGSYVARLLPDMLTMAEAPKPLAPAKGQAAGTGFEGHAFYEASSFRLIGDKRYFIYSSEVSHELCWAFAETPEGPITYGGVLHSCGNIGMPSSPTEAEAAYPWGNNHGSLAEVDGTVYVFGHRQTHSFECSRQGVAERVSIHPDGFIEQAEMTSCGLNSGPLDACRELPAYCCCHLRPAEGVVRYNTKTPLPDTQPRVWQDEDAGAATSRTAYVRGMRDGSEAGFKYLDFGESVTSVELEARGSFAGTVEVRLDTPDGALVATVSVEPSERWGWTLADLVAAASDVHAVFLVAHGEGSLDLRALRFAC